MNPIRFARVRTTTLATLNLAALLAVFAAHAPAQAYKDSGAGAAKPTLQRSGAPTIKVYSRETVVDVTVTDANGKPVHGLTQADFTVDQDGKPQSIHSFQEVDQSTTSPEQLKLPPNTYSNFQAVAGPLNILLLDDIYGGDIGQVRLAAAKFINNMAPGTQVALLAMGARLTVLQEPTTDPARLLKVVNTIIDPFFVEGDGCTIVIARNHAVVDQFKEIVNYLSGIKGRKNLIWINGGIPFLVFPHMRPGGTPGIINTQEESMNPQAPNIGVDPLCPYFETNLHKTYPLLADAQVTVYPLDPNGVWANEIGHSAMEVVAQATGGVALYGNNFLDELMAKAVDAGASYYTLSYIPPGVPHDGRYHKIGIKVDRPNLQMLYRKGYNAEDPVQIASVPKTVPGRAKRGTPPTAAANDTLADAVSPTAPPVIQLFFDVRVVPIPKPENPTDPPVMGFLDPKLKKMPWQLTRYAIFFMLPQKQIAFADDGDGNHNGAVKFDVAAFDSDGKMVSSVSRTRMLPLTNEQYRMFIATPFQFNQQLDLPRGKFTLRVGILDSVSKKVGSLEIPLTVGKKPPSVAPAARSAN